MLIRTRFLGPTNFRGARITATTTGVYGTPVRVTVPWDYAQSLDENHDRAASAALDKVRPSRHTDAPWAGYNEYVRAWDERAGGFTYIRPHGFNRVTL